MAAEPAPTTPDVLLEAIREDLAEAGFETTSGVIEPGSHLAVACRKPRCTVLLEPASDSPPEGPSAPFDQHRLVLRGFEGRTEEARRWLGAALACLKGREIFPAERREGEMEEKDGEAEREREQEGEREQEQEGEREQEQERGGERESRKLSLLDLCMGCGYEDPEVPGGVVYSRFFDVWGSIDSFGLTNLTEDLERGSLVFHSDNDCTMSGRSLLSRTLTSGHTRWSSEWPDPEVPLTRVFVTGLDDLSATMGGESRLLESLNHGVEAAAGGGCRVFTACTYAMIGDNVPEICHRCGGPGGAAIENVPPHVSGYEGLEERDWWHQFLDACDEAPPPREDALPSVNLVGYAAYNTPEIAHLRELLTAAGVALETVVLPHRSPDAARFFRRARLTLVSPGEPLPTIFSKRLRDREIPFIEPALPFGLEGTMRWLGAVLDGLGLPPLDSATAEKLLSRARSRVEPLRRAVEGAGVRAAVCFDAGTVQELLEPRFFFGADLEEIFRETGCRLHLVALPGRPSDEEHDGATVEALEQAGVSLLTYPIGTDPEEVLREQAFDHVYCDVAQGALAKRHGSLPMDIRSFRMGLEGAVANARLFASATRFSLYKRYHAHLPPGRGSNGGHER
jgi:hypothetical protein